MQAVRSPGIQEGSKSQRDARHDDKTLALPSFLLLAPNKPKLLAPVSRRVGQVPFAIPVAVRKPPPLQDEASTHPARMQRQSRPVYCITATLSACEGEGWSLLLELLLEHHRGPDPQTMGLYRQSDYETRIGGKSGGTRPPSLGFTLYGLRLTPYGPPLRPISTWLLLPAPTDFSN